MLEPPRYVQISHPGVAHVRTTQDTESRDVSHMWRGSRIVRTSSPRCSWKFGGLEVLGRGRPGRHPLTDRPSPGFVGLGEHFGLRRGPSWTAPFPTGPNGPSSCLGSASAPLCPDALWRSGASCAASSGRRSCCPPGGPRRGRAGDHRGEAERQAQRGAVAWSPEVIAALADAFVNVVGGAEREGSPDGGVLDLCAFESLPGA
jgi:hypothetical protein